jgi:hypothetical protein
MGVSLQSRWVISKGSSAAQGGPRGAGSSHFDQAPLRPSRPTLQSNFTMGLHRRRVIRSSLLIFPEISQVVLGRMASYWV